MKKSVMKNTIVPSVIAKNNGEFIERFEKLKVLGSKVKVVQLDVMDGHFVKNKSFMFDFKLPSAKLNYEVHLMCVEKNARIWLRNNLKKFSPGDMIIFHYETLNFGELIEEIKKKRLNVGVAVNPRTSSDKVLSFLDKVDLILIMAVQPGKYGAKFLSKTLNKVKKLRALNNEVNLEVDGGVNDKTISRMENFGANRFVVGSYLQNSDDILNDWNVLEGIVK